MYGWYGLIPGERLLYRFKEAGKKVTEKVKVIKEYPKFILVEVKGASGNYRTCINKSGIYTKETSIAVVKGGN